MEPLARDMRESVRKGAALLDADMPHWRHLIDVASLDIDHADNCVLGQLYGAYCFGLEALRVPYEESRLHGFTASRFTHVPTLQALWTKEIEEGRS